MTKSILFVGRAIIAFDILWMIVSFAGFIVFETNHVSDHYFIEYAFMYFHFATIVSMLYFTERKHEESATDYSLLNLDWKNTPLLAIPFFTDLRSLVRIAKSDPDEQYYVFIFSIAIAAMLITAAAIVWFIVAVCLTKKQSPSFGYWSLKVPLPKSRT